VGGRHGQDGRKRGSAVTITTVLGLLVAMGLTLFGLGAGDQAVANYDASSWLWSSPKGEVARVNGLTSRVDTRYQVPGATGHTMQVVQTDRYLVLRDVHSGQISAIDPATLQVSATMQATAGLGVSIALNGDAAFVIDAVQGLVRQLDPLRLTPIGEPVRFPPGISGGVFSGNGLLWLAVPTEGTVVAIAPVPVAPQGGSGGIGGAEASPREARTMPVAAPNHDLIISALDDGVAVLDKTTGRLTTLHGEAVRSVALNLTGPSVMPTRTIGRDVPVTLVDDRHVYIVNGDKVVDFVVPGEGPKLRACVAWMLRFYCPDDATSTIYALTNTGKLVDTIVVRGANGPLELEVREHHLFVNAPNSATARVVDEQHRVRVVDKFANDIVGGDPPPPAPPAPPPRPAVGKPGPPRSVTASAGDSRARVGWGAASPNGAAITKYVVEGAGKTVEVGANQRTIEFTGLVNGTTYRFSVYAVNAKGAGPKRTSNPVVPTRDVPDAPPSVTAAANADGTVEVTWPAANGQGRKILRYAVTAVSAGATAPVGESGTTRLVVAAGELEYGVQVAFTVVAINDKGAGSAPSPPSNSVVPFTVPALVQNLNATTVPTTKGAIRVTWQPGADNGRPITGYAVTTRLGRRTVTGTSVTLTGFNDGEAVRVQVYAINAAGNGAVATDTATTIRPPALTPGGVSATYSTVTVTSTVNDGGSPTTCRLAVSSGGFNRATAQVACGANAIGVWRAGTAYTFTITATNSAGSVSYGGSVSTRALSGVAVCNNNPGSSDPAQHTWCNNPANAMELSTAPSLASQVGRAVNGRSYAAFCRVAGEEIYAYVYNNHKRSTTWIRIAANGSEYYTPWAWFNLAAGDQPNNLPPC